MSYTVFVGDRWLVNLGQPVVIVAQYPLAVGNKVGVRAEVHVIFSNPRQSTNVEATAINTLTSKGTWDKEAKARTKLLESQLEGIAKLLIEQRWQQVAPTAAERSGGITLAAMKPKTVLHDAWMYKANSRAINQIIARTSDGDLKADLKSLMANEPLFEIDEYRPLK